jgi:hypothetical protein
MFFRRSHPRGGGSLIGSSPNLNTIILLLPQFFAP